jgi:23S rRNA (cytidine1920-2'-O)/16S rRNA (cytidine1409-2'-O)-methyltransferase
MKKNKVRLDKLITDRKLAETRSRAQAMLMAGEILVNGIPLTKPGTPVDELSDIEVKDRNPYVSRGGLKLEYPLEHFNIPLKNKICLDIGASTGGFTDCMLQKGAKRVFAVDVGKNQLHEKLRNDPRVINIENTNFRYFSPKSLKENIEFVTIDVSFISLEKILPVAVECLKEYGEILCLVKPQFEATARDLKKGVLRDESVRVQTIEKIKRFASGISLEILGSVDSKVKGPKGNIEHFLYMKKR